MKMMKITVQVAEVHSQMVEVEVPDDDPDPMRTAINMVVDADGVEGTKDYSHTLEPNEGWFVHKGQDFYRVHSEEDGYAFEKIG